MLLLLLILELISFGRAIPENVMKHVEAFGERMAASMDGSQIAISPESPIPGTHVVRGAWHRMSLKLRAAKTKPSKRRTSSTKSPLSSPRGEVTFLDMSPKHEKSAQNKKSPKHTRSTTYHDAQEEPEGAISV